MSVDASTDMWSQDNLESHDPGPEEPGLLGPKQPSKNILREYGGLPRVNLASYMTLHLYDAAGELPPDRRNDLFDRFIEWTR